LVLCSKCVRSSLCDSISSTLEVLESTSFSSSESVSDSASEAGPASEVGSASEVASEASIATNPTTTFPSYSASSCLDPDS